MRARVDPKKHAAIPAQDFLTKLLLLSDRLPPSAVTMSKMTQDAKKDEFRKYLEKAGVLELLTKSLVSVRFDWFLCSPTSIDCDVQLYEEPEKPNDALSYLKNSVGGRYLLDVLFRDSCTGRLHCTLLLAARQTRRRLPS